MSAPTLEPLAVFDVRTQEDWAAICADGDRLARLQEWIRSNGIDPNQTYRMEIYLLDCPFARVYQFALNTDGKRYIADGSNDVARRDPYDVILSSLPPGPEKEERIAS